jgi:NAD-dependent SIR2 family protein deacetylase
MPLDEKGRMVDRVKCGNCKHELNEQESLSLIDGKTVGYKVPLCADCKETEDIWNRGVQYDHANKTERG